MLTPQDRKAKYAQPEQLRKLRIRNLQKLAELFGWQELARRTGMSDQQLEQIAGQNQVRAVHDHQARAIELSVGLPHGWLDQNRTEQARQNAI